MNEFFSNLFARSFTDAPVIRPRLLSLFESSANQSFDESQSAAEIIAPPAQIASTQVKSSSIEETPTTKPITNVSAAPAEPRVPAPDAQTDQHATKSRDGPQASEPRKIEVETKTISVAENSPGDNKNNAHQRDRGFDASPRQPSLQVHRGRNRSSIEQQSSSPPAIRVTIGRVEVRAIHTPVPTPKPAKPAPPRISLEDYLRKRDRGTP
jgi:hypothetical protein